MPADDDRPRTAHARSLSDMRPYSDHLWKSLSRHLGYRVVAVGGGMAHWVRWLRRHSLVVALDTEPEPAGGADNGYGEDGPELQYVDGASAGLSALRGRQFDSALCLRCLEYLDDDNAVLAALGPLLEPGGRVVLQVPALHRLYGETDRAAGIFRRYEPEDLGAKLRAHGLRVAAMRYINQPGALAWYLNSRVLQRPDVPAWELRLGALLVPWLALEQRRQPRWGLMLEAVAERVQPAAAG